MKMPIMVPPGLCPARTALALPEMSQGRGTGALSRAFAVNAEHVVKKKQVRRASKLKTDTIAKE